MLIAINHPVSRHPLERVVGAWLQTKNPGSKAGVLPSKIVRPGVWWGIPIQPLDEYKRLNAHLGRLPHMREEIKELQKRIEELEARTRDGE